MYCSAITVRDLFPFGRDNGDDSLYAGTDGGAEDVSSAEIQLGTNVKFFGRDYGAIYVSYFLGYFKLDMEIPCG